MHTADFNYQISGNKYRGFLVYENSAQEEKAIKRPGVMIVPAFEGLTSVYKDMAKEYAKLGYAALVVDLYGDGIVCDTLEECLKYCMPHIEDRAMTRDKMLSIYEKFKFLDVVDANNIAIFGFCLGGLCALDLARAGADIKGAVSIHGVLAAPNLPENKIQAKILVLHGYEDPQVPPEQLADFAKEMNKDKVDWQCHFYGHTKHAFTDPQAAQIGPASMGREYNAMSTARAHQATQNFLEEVFA